jgi:hypothetical protein
MLLIKVIPILEAIRVPARWSFIFYLGFVFFALLGIEAIRKKIKSMYIYLFFILLIFIEYIPMNLKTYAEQYINSEYTTLKQFCSKEKLVLLEIPVTHLQVAPNIVTGVNYISKVELSSTYHGCYLANGYSGYDMPSIQLLSSKLNADISTENSQQFINDIRNHSVDIVKINTEFFIEELKIPGRKLIEDLQQMPNVTLLENTTFLIVD